MRSGRTVHLERLQRKGQAAAREVSVQPVVRVRPSAAASVECGGCRFRKAKPASVYGLVLGGGGGLGGGKGLRRRRCGGGSGGGGVECRRGAEAAALRWWVWRRRRGVPARDCASVMRSLAGRFRRGRRRGGGASGERSLGGDGRAVVGRADGQLGSLRRRQPRRGHHRALARLRGLLAQPTLSVMAPRSAVPAVFGCPSAAGRCSCPSTQLCTQTSTPRCTSHPDVRVRLRSTPGKVRA
jgi:hypothetical protein